MNRYNGQLMMESLDRGLLISHEEREPPLSIFCNTPRHVSHSPSIDSTLRNVLRDIPQPKYFIIGAKNFDRWLQGRKVMGQTYACIKNGHEYIMLDNEGIAHIINDIP